MGFGVCLCRPPPRGTRTRHIRLTLSHTTPEKLWFPPLSEGATTATGTLPATALLPDAATELFPALEPFPEAAAEPLPAVGYSPTLWRLGHAFSAEGGVSVLPISAWELPLRAPESPASQNSPPDSGPALPGALVSGWSGDG